MQFFIKESNRFTSLYEHSSSANPACIALKLEGLLKIRKLQQWCLCELRFEGIKSLLLCRSPLKWHSVLYQPVERCCNGAEIPHETPVKPARPRKLRTCVTVVGSGQLVMATIFASSTLMPRDPEGLGLVAEFP
jgi:hypothetical protein